jgi:hypothetical protein
MGRTLIRVDKQKLTDIIGSVEFTQQFSNRGDLIKEVSRKYCMQEGVTNVTPSVVYLRIKEWNIDLKTPRNKRGRKGGNPSIGTIPRVSRGIKFQSDDKVRISLTILNNITPERFKKVADRVKKGSMKAAIQLKCLDCCDYQTVEVRNCTCNECSLWAFRPYSNRK